jgi:hypothetical protein
MSGKLERIERYRPVRKVTEAPTVIGEPFVATIDEVKAALADITYDAVTFGQAQWEQVGAAVWAATGGSEDGLAAFDGWSQPWAHYERGASRKRWDTCAAYPASMSPGALFAMAEKAKQTKAQQAAADKEVQA